jgi:acyl-lipid omega-6 desaturase (Delta-12 desaturase)
MERNHYLQIRSELDFKKRWSPLFKFVLGDLFLMAAWFFLYQQEGWLSLASLDFVPVIMFRNFSLMHEAVHGTICHSKPLTSAIGFYAGVLCLLPYELWKKTHLHHHYWAGNYEQDGTLLIVKKFPASSSRTQKVFTFFWNRGIPYAGFSQNIVFWFLAAKQWKENPWSLRHAFSFLAPMSFWGVLFVTGSAIQVCSLLVGLIAYWRLVEVVNFPHHVGLYMDKMGENHLSARDQHQVTRTCQYPRLVEEWIVLNFNYHSEHHLFPDLPWHQLRLAHERLMQTPHISQINVVTHSWLKAQQKKSFMGFLFPAESSPTAPTETKKTA